MTENEIGISRILITKEQIARRVSEMGLLLSKDYKGQKVLLVSILKGAFVFLADIIREMTIPCEVDFMAVSSYKNGISTSGKLEILKDLSTDISGYNVIIIEDILDSGLTLNEVYKLLLSRRPRTLKVCTLLYKERPREGQIVKADYIGFSINDEFVVGYGLDYAEKFRGLSYIGICDFNGRPPFLSQKEMS